MTMAKEPADDDPRPVATDQMAGEPVEEPAIEEPDDEDTDTPSVTPGPPDAPPLTGG